MRHLNHRLVVAMSIASAVSLSCGKASDGDAKEDTTASTYAPVEGEEATQFLEGAARTDVIDDAGLAAILAMSTEENAEGATDSVGELNDVAVSLLEASQKAKDTFDPSGFVSPAETTFASEVLELESDPELGFLLASNLPPKVAATHDPKQDKLTWASKVKAKSDAIKSKTEFQISNVGKVSVKSQGQRGTCAAHTGVSAIEYKILKMFPDHIKSIDLSEQRYYMMAKKELWAKGGGKTNVDGGSAWGNANALSNGFNGETSPAKDVVKDKPVSYNIPLEADCPYNAQPGANELQLPQLTSCQTGAVYVSKVSTTWQWQNSGESQPSWYSNALRSAQDIFNYLVDEDLPVAISANITKNWETTTGVIKLKGETNQVLGGHAFLVVGARKLDEKKFPGEGGYCFIIKNSWGTGWGTNGYACMTLAWFNKYRHTGFFDVAHDVKVNLAYVKQRQKSGAKSKTNEPAKPVAVKVPKSSDNLLLVEDDPTAGVPTLEEDVPEVDADGFTAGGLVTPHGHVARGLHKVEGATISIKGVLADEAGHTQTLTLPYDGAGNIQLDVEGRGLVTVGVLKDGDVKLCSGRYEAVCHLNYVAADGRLTIGLTEAEHQRGEANPNAIYQSLVSIGDYGVEYSPASDTAIDVRLVKAGAPTSPLRLAVRPEDGVILARGRPVGSLTGLSLCNGEYRNACRLVVNTENGGLHVFFK